MIRLKVIAVFLFVLFCVQGRAQDVIYSSFEKFDYRTGDYAVAGKVGDRLYVYRGSSEGFFLDAFNDSMQRLATVLLDFLPEKVTEIKFINYHDKLILLYQAIEAGKLTQYAALLDNMGRLSGRPVVVATEKMGLFNENKSFFSSAVSEDKSNILIYGINERGEELHVRCIWLDDNLKITGRTNAEYKTDNNLAHGDALLSNEGVCYLPVYTPVGNRNYADQVWILSLKKETKAFTSVEFPLGEKYAAGTHMKLDNANDRIYIGGFYSDKKNGNYQGVLYAYYDIVSGSFQNTKALVFDEKMRRATGEQNKKHAFNDYQVRQLIIKNDGGFLLIAEDYFVTTRSSYAPAFGYYSWYYSSMASSVREYHYDDIMAMSYTRDGILEWDAFVRKSQYSQEDGGVFSSYALINTGGMIGFLYNDFNTSRSRVQLAYIDGMGKVNGQPLATDSPEGNPDWLPRSAKQVSAREIVVPCLYKRQICFAKVVF